jgi:hypothetical protein
MSPTTKSGVSLDISSIQEKAMSFNKTFSSCSTMNIRNKEENSYILSFEKIVGH